ncbi:MAG: molecular chaperone DnaJ [Oscillospiraceae bacterium]|jgi:molecular chaperone DnaJ|nr:molecular chaperone DnaJ [Oscillospiraceae bacterium]
MASKRDYYDVLEISKGASDADVKTAFRKKAKQYHPDLHPNDKEAEARFKEVNEAYEVLSDPQKRARYDQFGHEGVGQNGAGGFGFDGFSGGGIDSIFDMFFGGGGGGGQQRRNGPERGADLRYDMQITFEEAAFGAKKEFRYQRQENCEVCGGSGAKPGTTPEKCKTCNGSGQVKTTMNSLFGPTVTVRTCSACGGSGRIIVDRCLKCGGNGRVRVTKSDIVNIPAGVDDGQGLTLSGKGEPGRKGGPAGDLLVFISVKPHKLFKREGYNLFCEIPLSFTQAALGGEIQIPTLEGPIVHNIPEGTQNDAEFRFRGHGVTSLRGTGKGDLYVRVRVDIPKKLTERQKSLLREFEDSLTGREYEGRRSFLDRMKDLFTAREG